MSEEQSGEGGVAVLTPGEMLQMTSPDLAAGVQAEIEAVTTGVAELQQHIQQLQEQHSTAENQNAALRAALESERVLHQQQLLQQLEEVPAPGDILENGLAARVQHLEHELQCRTEERENYKNRLQAAERQVTELQSAKEAAETISRAAAADLGDKTERAAVQGTLEKLTSTLKEQTEQCERFERQNTQLHGQVKALKEVISVHKDLLAIRQLESDQLKTTIRLLEDHSKAEKERRAAVLAKMEAAVRLNSELKNEYETQLRIFQDLREKYELKVQLLHAENERIKALVPPEAAAEVEPTEALPEAAAGEEPFEGQPDDLPPPPIEEQLEDLLLPPPPPPPQEDPLVEQ